MSSTDPSSAVDGFYVVWRKDPVAVMITKGTKMSDALTAAALLGADDDTLNSLSTPAALTKARTVLKELHAAPPAQSAPTHSALSYGPGRA